MEALANIYTRIWIRDRNASFSSCLWRYARVSSQDDDVEYEVVAYPTMPILWVKNEVDILNCTCQK